ncbi:kinase-like domain-containing protein [Mycena leptocephala]|nr:kinase-like domain-containing protein [Mycena leptocephala]
MTLISTPMLSEKSTLSGTLSESSPTPLLTCREQFWAESYEFLLSHGYQLRPRYHPEWVPSWGPKRNPIRHECDDFLTSYKTNTLDALCIKDNQKVVLKRVNGKELKILRHLDALRSDARNHTIPLLDVIPFPGTEWTFVAMPYCRRFNSPLFHCRGEFMDAMTQYIEGLQFMHEHNVVHFDIATQNMVIEESRIIPKGSHWCNPDSHSGFPGDFFSWKNRCSLRPAVQYYYIDFGLSKHFPGGKESARITATLRTFPMIPELSLTVPYNPFYVDVFQLGLAMSRIIDVYPALEDFRIVAASLTVDDPHARATLEDALKELNCVCDQMSPSLRRKRIWEKGITRWKKVTRIVFGGQWGD